MDLRNIKNIISDYFIIIASAGVILPFLVISYFNHPSQDDYCQINALKEMGYWNYQTWIREKWGGRFTSYALSSLVKVIEDNLYIYKTFPVVLFILLFLAIYFVVRQVFKSSNIFALKASLLLFVLYIAQYKDIAEGFYWMSSAFTYQVGNIITIFLLGIISILQTRKSYLLSVLGVICVTLLVGTNEVSMILVDFSLFSILVFNYITHKKLNAQILILVCFALISSYIVISAEGNYIRLERYPYKHLFLKSSIKSSLQAIYSICLWLGLSLFTAFIIFSESLKHKVTFETSKKINFKILVFYCFVLTSLGFFVGFWATGETLAHRARNVVYLFFLVSFFYVIFSYLDKNKSLKEVVVSIPKFFSVIVFISYFSVIFSKENINDCFVDLMKNKALKYDIELKERNAFTINNLGKKELEIPPLKAIPKTLFVTDFKYDKNYHFNRWYAQYWGFDSVKLKCE